jgi:hypothetical protein
MSLPINPQASFVGKLSSEFQQASQQAQASFVASSNELEKLALDEKVSRLSGELNSGLNQFNASKNQTLGEFNRITGAAQSALSNITGTLQSVAGSTSNIAADISGGLEKLGAGSLSGGLKSAAGAISKTAGMLNNILSLTRAANLPAGAELFSAQGESLKVEPNAKNDWRVRVNCNWSIFGSNPMFQLLKSTNGAVFPLTPEVFIGTSASYSAIDPTHSIYPIQAYKNSTVNAITISGDFPAETQSDAAYWLAATTFFKTATKMFFGQGENVGNPPVICTLAGYGPSVFPNVPVVITNFEVQLGAETDYIKCEKFGEPTWVPVLSKINITAVPIYSRSRLRQFNLQEYARGKLVSGNGIGFI